MQPEAGQVQPVRWGEGEIRGPVHLFREGLLLRVLRQRLPGGRVLDAGCGSGSLALDLCRLGYQVDAVEASAEFVELVRRRSAQLGCGQRLSVRQGSVASLGFGPGGFDGVVCAEVLEHLRPAEGGDRAAVLEVARVLHPHGICVASVPLNPALWDHCDVWAGHVQRYTPAGLTELFTQAGFAVEEIRYWGFPLGRVYHRLLFAPWVRRGAGQNLQEREARLDTRAGRHPLAVHLIAALLRLDEAFGRWPWGRGMVLCGRLQPGTDREVGSAPADQTADRAPRRSRG